MRDSEGLGLRVSTTVNLEEAPLAHSAHEVLLLRETVVATSGKVARSRGARGGKRQRCRGVEVARGHTHKHTHMGEWREERSGEASQQQQKRQQQKRRRRRRDA